MPNSQDQLGKYENLLYGYPSLTSSALPKYYDDESNAQKTATLADKLIKEDKVNLLLGPYGTSGTLQMSTVAEKAKIPMVEGNGAAESIFNQGYAWGQPEPGDHFGASLAVGNFDSDPRMDLVSGAPDEDAGGFADVGYFNVVYGSANGIVNTGAREFGQGAAGGTVEAADRFASALR